ncbi:hypothetical protein KOW79_002931 [Hemibagrus wyckioides]|uniref:Uncharacterized protein n=1 Tax=Hemibagrus wyckioides TaxID=337641 RepID=A0A9D3P5M9_9TELE|nr:hypothetical protein KOW79_002931 [Hemibagrus wyckioides]
MNRRVSAGWQAAVTAWCASQQLFRGLTQISRFSSAAPLSISGSGAVVNVPLSLAFFLLRTTHVIRTRSKPHVLHHNAGDSLCRSAVNGIDQSHAEEGRNTLLLYCPIDLLPSCPASPGGFHFFPLSSLASVSGVQCSSSAGKALLSRSNSVKGADCLEGAENTNRRAV